MLRASVMAFGLGSFIVLARLLSKQDMGVWVLFMVLTTSLELARNGLIQNALIKYLLSSGPAEHGRIHTASLALNALAALAIALLLFVLAQPLSLLWQAPALRDMLWLYASTTLILTTFSQSEFLMQARWDFKSILLGYLLRFGSFFGALLLCFVVNMPISLLSLTAIHAVSALLGALLMMYFAFPGTLFEPVLDKNWLRRLFSFGANGLGTNLSAMVLSSVDAYLLGALSAGRTAAVATYNAAIRITNLAQAPVDALTSVAYPKAAAGFAESGRPAVRALYEKSVGVLLALIVPAISVVALMPELFIRILAGSKYLDSVPVLRLTMLFGLIMPFTRMFGTAMDAIGKPRSNFLVVLATALLSIALNYLLIQRYDLMGAAYAMLGTYSFMWVLSWVLMRRFFDVSMRSILRNALLFYPQMIGILKARLANHGPSLSAPSSDQPITHP